jgi:transcriptional regulator with XRE-family HTH domain
MKPIEQHVIDTVIKLRLEKKLKQKDIAEILQVSLSFIGNVENPNNPAKYNLNHISQLAEFFELSPHQFLP